MQTCPRCANGGGGTLWRLRIRGLPGIYLTCDECDATWAADEFSSDDYTHGLHDFDALLGENGAVYPADVTWLDDDHPFRA